MREFIGYKKGVNLGGWLSQCCHEKEYYESFIQEEDIAKIASWGVDHIRLPIDYVVVQNDEGCMLTEGFSYIDRCIQWCNAHGLNLILDLHKTQGYAFDSDEFDFFRQEELQNRFYTLWERFAQLYGSYHETISFELLNEITDMQYAELWNKIARNTIKIIRRHAPDTHILLGGVWNNSIDALSFLDAPVDDKIVYNFHYYDPMPFTHQKAYWIPTMSSEFTINYPAGREEYIAGARDNLSEGLTISLEQYDKDVIDRQYLEQQLSIADRISRERNVPVYCGEYGVINRVEAKRAIQWYKDVHNVFEKFQIGRAIWTYKEMDFGMIDAERSEILKELITLL